MSETVTIGSATAQIYGTYAAAVDYMSTMFGDAYAAWLLLLVDDRKRTLVAATRYLDRQAWVSDYDTFAERDALPAFPQASYELAAMVAEDPAIVTVVDSGTNIADVGAGGAYVKYFNPTSVRFGSASTLPPILQSLVGTYLAASGAAAAIGGSGQSGDCVDPFSECVDLDDRRWPY